MKKILFLLLFTIASYGQAVFDEGIQIKNNTTDNSATKVNVQSTDGTINTISKSDLVNVVEVNDVPSLPLIGEAGKIYVVKNLNKIYRWNGTFYQELTTDISGKEDIANKQNSLAVDGTNAKYPTVTAVNTGLALKANLASPALTGTPTATTATAGTHTTQIATTAFVGSAVSTSLSNVVNLNGSQAITGIKSHTVPINLKTININVSTTDKAIDIVTTSTANALTINNGNTGLSIVGQNSGVNTFTVNKFGATTATSFIKSSSQTTNILLAGGGDIAQNTAFNKNFGTTAGTVVEGGTLGSNAYNSTPYLPLTGGTLTGILNIDGVDSPKIFFQQNSSLISLITNNFGIYGTGSKTDFNTYVYGNNPYGIWTNGVKRVTVGGDGSTTFSGTVTASSYTATSLPVFENNAAASSLAVGQFYRTSIGVLMVKF